ncbi:MAG TPA: CDP-archaeol synthase [Gemmatimonadales bacterium]|nr:CDP-archaeol synthase [Gemmatimonadales bacterium]
MPDELPAPDPVCCALFLILSFSLAGVAQTWWFRSPRSERFAVPLDGGRTFRGRRIFGSNKTWKGFVVMVPATALAFLVVGTLARVLPVGRGLWPLSPAGYAWLGAVASGGFMAGELPNSFVKRQLAIAPGDAPRARGARCIAFAMDRLDSILGMLLAVSLAVPTAWQVWALVLCLGPGIHWLFNVALFLLGVKARPA